MAGKILVHSCCAPCLCYPLKVLINDGFDVTGYWYNPNIHGIREYQKRLMAFGYLVGKNRKINIIEGKYEPKDWFNEAGQKGWSKPGRCVQCYIIRLNAAARTAKENGIGLFTTTLLYSKYQDHEEIKKICEKTSDNYGLEFLYKDFRAGWKEGINISKGMGLYRQNYCGCIFSEMGR